MAMTRTSRLGRPRARIGRSDGAAVRRFLDSVAALALIVLVWWLASLAEPSFLLPSPWVVLPELPGRLGAFVAQLLRSLARLAVGYGVALAVGLSSVAVASLVPAIRRLLIALVGMLQAVPPIAFMPLLVLLLGFGDAPVAMVVGLAAYYPLAIGGQNALAHVDETHLGRACWGHRSACAVAGWCCRPCCPS